MIDVSVIVPVQNEAQTLTPFLVSLFAQDHAPSEVIVVDAGSTDSTNQILRTHAANGSLRLVETAPVYPGRARTIAIRAAATPWIAMTDAGTIVDAAWLSELTAAAARSPEAEVVFGSYEPIVGTFFEKCAALSFVAPLRTTDEGRFRGPGTASLLVRKKVWEDLGGFPEDLRACEDLLLFERLSERGIRSACAPNATVKWRVPGSIGQLFRRFRTYSCHTLKAGLGSHWHKAVFRMYLAAAIAIAFGVLVHPIFLLVPIAALLFRAVRSVKARPEVVAVSRPVTVAAFGTIALILLCIDLAAAIGTVDYAVAMIANRGCA